MPAVSVVVFQVVPRSTSRAVTVAPGIAEPEESVMVPVIDPAACWANAAGAAPDKIKVQTDLARAKRIP